MKDNVISKLSWQFAKKYRITILFWLILLVFGLLSYTTFLKREGFPPIDIPTSVVQGTYFADNPKKVDTDVVVPISKAIDDIDNVDSYYTTSGDNYYTLVVTFKDDVKSEDGAKELKAAIEDVAGLPQDTTPKVSAIDPSKFNNKYNLLLAVYDTSDSSYADLSKKATDVASEIATSKDIELAEAIDVTSPTTTPGGETTQRQTAINKVAVREGGELKYYPAISVGVIKKDSVDAVQLSTLVGQKLDELNGQPEFENVSTTITGDTAKSINEQIDSLQSNLIGGLIAVIIVTLLLISWRAALVTAMFIPTVLAATFAGLGLFGLTINTITLFSVILTLGLFVDDATIIVEAIDAHRRKQLSHKQIIKAAVGRVGMASIAGTLTTMIVFAPMLLVSGILGDFIRLMPITVMVALALSLVISLILIPFLSRIFVLGGKKSGGLLDKLSIFVPIERYLGNTLSKLPLLNRDNKKKGRIVTTLMVGISVLAVVGAGIFASKLSLDIFPQSKDGNILVANVEFKTGTTIEQANDITKQLDSRLRDTLGEALTSVTYVDANERSAMVQMDLTHYNGRSETSHDLLAKLEAQGDALGDATVTYTQEDAGPPSSDFPFQMRVYANDEATLQAAASEVTAFLHNKTITADGTEVKVAEATNSNADGTVNRTERGVFATVSARFDNTDYNSAGVIELEQVVANEFNDKKLESLNLATDAFDFDVSQESANADSFSSMGIGLIGAIVLMYLLLVVLYNSFLQPLLIFTAIPFSLFGVFFGLWLTDNSLSFFVMVGMMGLIGIVVNNTILLTEYANQERAAGADRFTAISRAVKDRFRPLLATTLTTVFALVPLALNDPFWQALANTLIFGMLSSVVLIILSFPYYYLLTERIRDWKNRKFPALR